MRYCFTVFALVLGFSLAACAADPGWNIASNGNGDYQSGGSVTYHQTLLAAPAPYHADGEGGGIENP